MKKQLEGIIREYISFEKLICNGNILEEFTEFNHSIYRDVYDDAANIVEKIIKENEYRKNDSKSMTSDFCEIDNVISFIGRRGTGKTTAMCSFERYLTANSGSEYSGMKKNALENVRFYGLDHIDASMLEEKEEIFPQILANMFNRMLSVVEQDAVRQNEYKYRSLIQQFEEVYENFMAVTSENDCQEGYATFEKLRGLSSSRRVRADFTSLVEKYLNFISESQYCPEGRKNYLVIVIDDVDLAFHNLDKNKVDYGAYKIMNSIHKYLSVPGTIILTAYNIDSLFKRCSNFFYLQYNGQNCGMMDAIRKEKESDRTASEYMQKVFPTYARLYMPSWKKRDIETMDTIYISTANCHIGGMSDLFKRKYYWKIKEFILCFLAEKTGVYFDCGGRKTHFLEPDTLRSLFDFSEFLLDMPSYQSQETLDMAQKIRIHNIKKLKEDCSFRFIREKLPLEEYNIIEKWMEAPIDRRGVAIVREICKDLYPLGIKLKEEFKDTIQNASLQKNVPSGIRNLDNSDVEYSYAELLHGIYHITRSEHGEEKRYSKHLTAALLYSYTAYLAGVFCSYQNAKELLADADNHTNEIEEIRKRKEQNYQILVSILGPALCGKWTEYFFPAVRVGLNENSNRDLKAPNIPESAVIGYMERCRMKYSTKCRIEDPKSIRQMLYEIIYISMFYKNMLHWGEDDFKVEIFTDEKSKTREINVEITQSENDDFDMTGFFKYTFCYEEFFKAIAGLFEKGLKKEEARFRQSAVSLYIQEDYLMNAKRKILNELKVIHKEYDVWDRQNGNMMIPFYNLDITYNLIKRIYRECTLNGKRIIDLNIYSPDSIFMNEFENMLERFSKRLKEIDLFYELSDSKNSLESAFIKCPYILMLPELKKNKDSCGRITRYIIRTAQYYFEILDTFESPVE